MLEEEQSGYRRRYGSIDYPYEVTVAIILIFSGKEEIQTLVELAKAEKVESPGAVDDCGRVITVNTMKI